jgi:hypothetical protein
MALDAIAKYEPPQDMPVAFLLIFGTVAKQRHATPSRESLDQTQCELLAAVLDRSAALVDRPVKEKLLSILPRELRPGDFAILDGGQKALARTQVGHPYVVPRCWQSAAANARYQNSQAISPTIDGRPDALRF